MAGKPIAAFPHLRASVLAIIVSALTFFLRVYRLADKNIWWDEGWSLWLARQDFAAIALRTAADEHPPMHYWMLRVWDSIAGWDAFSARFLSVAFGVLTVGLIYQIGKRVGGKWIGVLAALFLGTARFHIWWSQDIKNYTPSIFFAFAAVWFGLNVIASPERAKQSPRSVREIASSRKTLLAMTCYALFAVLAMLTHYLAALVLLALNIYALFVILSEAKNLVASRDNKTLRFAQGDKPNLSPLLPRSRAPLLTWLLANALAAILFVPWLVLYLQNAQAWSAAPAFDFGLFLKLIATALPLGVTTNIDDYAGLTIAFTTLAVLGALAVNSQQSTVNSKEPLFTVHRSLFTIIVLLPPILIYALSLTPVSFFAPKIQARYLLILYPAYAILVALGIALFRRFSLYLALAATVFVLASSAIVMRDYYAERRLTDDYATLANSINSFARQGDLVLLDTDQEWPMFLYYLRAPIDWLGVPNGKTMRDSDADSLVRRALVRHSAVWLVTIPDALTTDPSKTLQARLARQVHKALEKTYGNKQLVLYTLDERDLDHVLQANLRIQHPLPYVLFDDPTLPAGHQAILTGYDLPIREAYAGDVIYITTYWIAGTAHGEIQLADASSTVVTSAPLDIAIGKDTRVVTTLGIPATASGPYTISARVFNCSLEFAHISVEPRAAIASALSISHPTDYRLGDSIHLVGYDLPVTKYGAGESVPVTLYWRADQPIAKSFVVFVHLLGTEFNAAQNNFLWGQIDHVPRDGSYPITAWQPNQIVSDPYQVPLAPNAPAGKYKIEVGMYDVTTGVRLKLGDGSDSIILAGIEVAR